MVRDRNETIDAIIERLGEMTAEELRAVCAAMGYEIPGSNQ